MGVAEILTTIDNEIAQLQQARALLSGAATPTAKKKAGRPKKVVAAAKKAMAAPAIIIFCITRSTPLWRCWIQHRTPRLNRS